jgi:hypothetical protein
MTQSNRALPLALATSGMLVFAASVFPMWTYMEVSGCCGLVRGVSLWQWLAIGDENGIVTERQRGDNLARLSIVMGVAGAAGLVVYTDRKRRFRAEEMSDYADGPTGAVLDGRLK